MELRSGSIYSIPGTQAWSCDFNLHSCYYNDFFLLRTLITINGRPAEIKLAESGSEKGPCLFFGRGTGAKSLHLSKATRLVECTLSQYGIYRVDTFYYEHVPSFSVLFSSYSQFEMFLLKMEEVQTKLAKALAVEIGIDSKSDKETLQTKSAKPLAAEIESESKSGEEALIDAVSVTAELYLVSPSHRECPGSNAKVFRVTMDNVPHCVNKWERSAQFDFNAKLFTESGKTVETEAELKDLHRELHGVVEWLEFGIQVGIPFEDLKKICKDCHFQTDDCRIQMLAKWQDIDSPTWEKVIEGLYAIRKLSLSNKIAQSYLGMSAEDLISRKHKLKEEPEPLQNEGLSAHHIKELELEIEKVELEVEVEVTHMKDKMRFMEKSIRLLEEADKSMGEEWKKQNEELRREINEQIRGLEKEIQRKDEEPKRAREELQIMEKAVQEKENKQGSQGLTGQSDGHASTATKMSYRDAVARKLAERKQKRDGMTDGNGKADRNRTTGGTKQNRDGTPGVKGIQEEIKNGQTKILELLQKQGINDTQTEILQQHQKLRESQTEMLKQQQGLKDGQTEMLQQLRQDQIENLRGLRVDQNDMLRHIDDTLAEMRKMNSQMLQDIVERLVSQHGVPVRVVCPHSNSTCVCGRSV